jgi:vanillate O-demethylase monooxygenase subunit
MMSDGQPSQVTWLRDSWYQAAWSHELSNDKPVVRTILERTLLLFRDELGFPRAILDRCPHRFAPLSAGTVANGRVRCGYHGLAFDGHGRCVDNPHGAITSAMCVGSFRVVERYEAIWVWMGPSPAEEALLADLTFIDKTPKSARFFGYLPTAANYQLITDNILDLSHADYLHPSSLGGIMTGAKSSTREHDDALTVEWRSDNCNPPPAFYSMVMPPGRADIWTQVVWRAPALMILTTGATQAGTVRSPMNEATTLHNITPATGTSSHYFFCSCRQFKTDDSDFNSMLCELITAAFRDEDKPMLEKQQANMGTADLWVLKPMLLSIDAAAARARRILERLIDAPR